MLFFDWMMCFGMRFVECFMFHALQPKFGQAETEGKRVLIQIAEKKELKHRNGGPGIPQRKSICSIAFLNSKRYCGLKKYKFD